eukprot:gene13910-biopygen5308
MAKQATDGAVKAKGKQRGEDCERAEQRKAAEKLAENAGGAPALVIPGTFRFRERRRRRDFSVVTMRERARSQWAPEPRPRLFRGRRDCACYPRNL